MPLDEHVHVHGERHLRHGALSVEVEPVADAAAIVQRPLPEEICSRRTTYVVPVIAAKLKRYGVRSPTTPEKVPTSVPFTSTRKSPAAVQKPPSKWMSSMSRCVAY